ncbi:MAG: protein-tyrosine phosphatase family protein [Candidatus Acidiferrales bacterium]
MGCSNRAASATFRSLGAASTAPTTATSRNSCNCCATTPDQKVLVHCRRGAERTGVMIATYRMTKQGWTAEQALEEMEAFKFRGFWFRHLKKYVGAYPEQLKSDAALSALRAPAQPAAAPAAP